MPSILTIPKLVYNNKFNLPSLPPLNSFQGQTVLVTGATGGIGLAAAVHRNHHLFYSLFLTLSSG